MLIRFTTRLIPQLALIILMLVPLWSNTSYAYAIWPSGTSGWNHQPVTFCLDHSHGTNDIAGDGEWNAILNAFNTWDAVPTSSLSFTESVACARNGTGIDIYIGGWADPSPNFWNTNSNVLAVTFQYFPYTPNLSYSEVWFNDAYNWNIGSDYDVETVALHEIGHTFGLDHSIANSVMYAYYQGVRTTLYQDDIDGVSHLYPVPEPSTLILLTFGITAIGFRRFYK